MKLFIVAVPLFDSNMAVSAYRLCYQSSDKSLGLQDDFTALSNAMYSPGLETVASVGIEPFTGGKPLFVDINQYQLLSRLPLASNIPRELLVCVLGRDITDDPIFSHYIWELKEAGISIAVELRHSAGRKSLCAFADFAILDASSTDFSDSLTTELRTGQGRKVLISDVADRESYENLRNLPNTLFHGWFYSKPITLNARGVSPLKVNAVRLLKLVNDDNFSLENAAAIIEKDVSISLSLLRFINSPGIGVTRRIESIKSAVLLLGQKEMKKWINAAFSMKLGEDKPGEITKLSLIRAKFAENLSRPLGMAGNSSTLFLMGLFSLIDVILDMPIDRAVDEISLDSRIREALVNGKGEFVDVLDLIYSYEQANWANVSIVMIRRNLEGDEINKAFMNALLWYRELLEQIGVNPLG